eukprot:COSAG04_NODE_4382_length_2128_cov_4.918186_3_plen_136_part_00
MVLPHVSLALTPGATVLPLINAGAYDGALREFADAIPRLGRPMFLRIGYEFNGHWNNYTAGGYIAAWRRLVAAIGKVPRAREATATVWDMSCDAVRGHDGCTSAEECFAEYWPGDDVVDCAHTDRCPLISLPGLH